MSALALKILACVSMLLDHIGFFWNIHSLRVIGRIAFPIFVYMIYNGYRHTSSKGKYLIYIEKVLLQWLCWHSRKIQRK